jgi:class 3 adenylate cyclase
MAEPETDKSPVQRRLTTICCADVQGYSRLMEADEEGTLATLRQYRDAMARLIAAHGGRVVNTWGDGVLAEFPSVVEAVRAAVDVQNELAGHNAGRPTETRMLFRIGINLGDVIAEGNDIYGDGVNIAARLQTQAAPGGIVISSTVYDQVRNKVGVAFDFLGNLSVKNIEEGIPSYAVRIGDSPTEPQPQRWGRTGSELGHRAAAAPGVSTGWSSGRGLGALAAAAVLVVAINLFTWSGTFWAKWPLLAFAWIAGLAFSRATRLVDGRIAALGVIGVGVVVINLFTWNGEFWAKWPLLGLAAVAAVSLLRRRRAGPMG